MGPPKRKPRGSGSAGRRKLNSREGISVKRTKHLDEEIFKDPLSWKVFTKDQVEELEGLGLTEAFTKIAKYQSIQGWKQSLRQNLAVSFHFNNYIYALDSKFTPIQISTFCSIMKALLDISIEKEIHVDDLYRLFTEILVMHSDVSMIDMATYEPDTAWDIFGPKEVDLITEYAMRTIFQNYRLYQRSFGKDQEVENVVVTLDLDTLSDLPSLSEAMPIEAYDAEQRKKAEEDAKLKAEMDLLAIEQNAKIINPFEALSIDEVKQITSETIKSVLSELGHDYEKMFDDQREKFTAQIAKLIQPSP